MGLFIDSYCYFQLTNFLYPGNVNYTILLQSKYWLSENIHVNFDTLLYLVEVFQILCLKFCFIVFSMCRRKLYQILSITRNVPCFVLLITGYFKALYYTGQNCSGVFFSVETATKSKQNDSIFKSYDFNQIVCW